MASEDLPVTLKGLVSTPTGCGVFLNHGEKNIAIFVDHGIAAAISLLLHKVKNPRPLTHDLIGSILAGLGVTVQKVVVNDLKEEVFYARLYLLQENELGRNLLEIDSRPSDAIALALQQGCPIFVRRKVWDQADDMTWALNQANQQGLAGFDPEAGAPPAGE